MTHEPISNQESIVSSKLLIDESPVTFPPSLAILIGLKQCLLIQQLHFWLRQKYQDPSQYQNHFYEGFFWVHMTLKEWTYWFPYFSKMDSKNKSKTIQRLIDDLIELDLIEIQRLSDPDGDQTNWYRIKYENLRRLESDRADDLDDISRNKKKRKSFTEVLRGKKEFSKGRF